MYHIPSPPSELPCCTCGAPVEWKYVEVCPKCKTHVDFTLDSWYDHHARVKEQHDSHGFDEAQLDESLVELQQFQMRNDRWNIAEPDEAFPEPDSLDIY